MGRSVKKALYIAILALAALGATLGVALAQPPISAVFLGGVTRADGRPVPDGAVVYATVDDYKSPESRVTGGRYDISVGPPTGAYSGRVIRFWVDEDGPGPILAVEATPPQAVTFSAGDTKTGWNLTYTPAPPPTPTPTPAATSTPTPLPPTPTATLPPTGTSSLAYLALGVAALGAASLLFGGWAWRRGRARA